MLHEAGVPQAVAEMVVGHDSPAVHQRYARMGGEAAARHRVVSKNSITTDCADFQAVGMRTTGPISDRAGGFRTVRLHQ